MSQKRLNLIRYGAQTEPLTVSLSKPFSSKMALFLGTGGGDPDKVYTQSDDTSIYYQPDGISLYKRPEG